MKRLAGALVAFGVVGVISAFVLWALPADEFVFEPGTAKPLAERVVVEDAKPARGEVYYVDVFVRRSTRLEELLPFLLPDGSTVVPEDELLPPGTSEADRDRQTAEDMERSEEIASAVALRAAGLDVRATPRGALVVSVADDVPATGKVKPGDIIVAVDGEAVPTREDLRREVGKRNAGDPVELTIRRGDNTIRVTTRTVSSPGPIEKGRPIIGIQVEQEADIKLPIDVDIDLGNVGGPSAGLAFGLEVLRMLGRDVTEGCNVAATGELALDGSVLPVGGLKQKTIGARRAGVDAFLVPAGENTRVARMYAKDLPVIPVDSFQQALQKLSTADLEC
jgi:PDZ domain-containing protein